MDMGSENTMSRGFDKSYGYMQRGQITMGKLFDIPWIGSFIYDG